MPISAERVLVQVLHRSERLLPELSPSCRWIHTSQVVSGSSYVGKWAGRLFHYGSVVAKRGALSPTAQACQMEA